MTIQSVPQLLAERIESSPEDTAFLRKLDQSWQEISWREFGDMIGRFSKSLLALGVEAGTRVSILSETRLEWWSAIPAS